MKRIALSALYLGLVWLHWGLHFAWQTRELFYKTYRERMADSLFVALTPIGWIWGAASSGFYEDGWKNPLVNPALASWLSDIKPNEWTDRPFRVGDWVEIKPSHDFSNDIYDACPWVPEADGYRCIPNFHYAYDRLLNTPILSDHKKWAILKELQECYRCHMP